MKRNSKAALKSVPKHQNGIVLLNANHLSGNKTYSAAAAAASSKVDRSSTNGSGAMVAAADNAVPHVKPTKQNYPAVDSISDVAEGTASVDLRMVNGVLDPRKRNGISVGNGQDGKPAKQQQTASENQVRLAEGESWIQQSDLTGFGDSVVDSGSSAAECKKVQPVVNFAVPIENEPKIKMAADDRKPATDSVQKQITHELKHVKILQRPASVAKCQTPEKNPDLHPFSHGSPHPRKPREKCLSLNTEEREHLENLIENLIISCVENEDDSSSEELGADVAPRTVRLDVGSRPTFGLGRGKSPGKVEGPAVQTNASKTEREARSETPRGSALRNETGGKGRKFVKETGGSRNAGRGKDQGRRRENSKVKDNRKTGDFQPTRTNEESRPPAQQDNLQDRQDMMSADVYPAQLKVAIKHMDALPPRFLRRIQNGKGGFSGSEPALFGMNDDRSETPTLSGDDLKASRSAGKDLDRSRQNKKQGVKNMIRNLLNNMDDDEQQLETGSRRTGLDFALGAIGERREVKVTDSSVRDAFLAGGLQSSNTSLDRMPTSLALFSNGFDPFQLTAVLLDEARTEAGFPTKRSGPAASQGLNPDPDFRNHATYAAEWNNAYDGFVAPAGAQSATKKASFSVNAPEFVSKFYEQQHPTATSDAKENEINANLSRYGYLNANRDMGNQFSSQQQMTSNMAAVRNMVQPEYFGSAGLMRYPSLSNVPAAARDIGSTYTNPDVFSSELVPGHGSTNADPLQLMRLMQYNARGYVHPLQMQMLQQQLSQEQHQHSQPQLQQQQQQQQLVAQQQQLYPQQMLPPSHLNQAFVAGGVRVPVAGNPTQAPWPSGNQGAYPTVAPSQNALPLQLLPFEIGRQMLMKLMSEGRHVMVILVGRVDGNKFSLISELQTNVSGTLVLNLRNGLSPNSDEKEMEFHRWNYKQALDATQMLKNPIIIDHTYAQPWQMKDYIGLAQMNKYLVQIIDCDEARHYRAVPNVGSYARDDQVSRLQSAMEVLPGDMENGTAVDVSRCNIPGVENNASSVSSSQLSSCPALATLSLSCDLDVARGGTVPALNL